MQPPSPESSEGVKYELPTNTWHTQSAQDLIVATNDALRSTSVFSTTLLTVCAFLVLATLATDHEGLLRREVVLIPLYLVRVNPVWFFGIAPWVVLMLHLDLLLRTRLTTARLNAALKALGSLSREDQASLIQSLHIVPIAEWVVSACREDRLEHRLLFFAVVFILIVFPTIILAGMFGILLPLHHLFVSWMQASVLFLDLIVIYLLRPFPRISCEDRTPSVQKANIRPLSVQGVCLVIAVLLLLGLPVAALFWVRPLELSDRSLTVKDLPAGTVRDLEQCLPFEEQSEALGEIRPLDLKKRDLRGIRLRESLLPHASLVEARMRGADLTGAFLPHADLTLAKMAEARLDGACLRSAHLEGATLDGSQAKDVRLEDANLEGASMRGIKWEGAKLRGANLRDAKLIDDIELNGADLRGADLHRAETEIQGADLTGVDFRGARLDKVQLRNSELSVDTRLILADLEGMVMESLTAPSADFRGAVMRDVDFGTGEKAEKMDLSNARLIGADLRETAWFTTDHEGADFSLADLRGAHPCPPERPDCHSPPWAFVDQEKPCLLERAAGPCIGENRIEEYDEKLAEFLVGLACEDGPAKNDWQGVADRHRLGCALLQRLRRTLEYEPDRPLVKHLAKGLHTTRCPGIPEWGTKMREDLWRLRLGEPLIRIDSELCPASRE